MNLSRNLSKLIKNRYFILSWISAIAIGIFSICIAVSAKQDNVCAINDVAEIKAIYADISDKCPLPEFGTDLEDSFLVNPDSCILNDKAYVVKEDIGEAFWIEETSEMVPYIEVAEANPGEPTEDKSVESSGVIKLLTVYASSNTATEEEKTQLKNKAEPEEKEQKEDASEQIILDSSRVYGTENVFKMEKPFDGEFKKYNASSDGFVYLEQIPLDRRVQEYIYFMSRKYGVDYSLVLAVMYHESNFQYNASSPSGRDHGLMQINSCNSGYLYDNLGVTDLDNPYQNIQSGVWMLSNLVHKYDTVSMALMAYNCGEGGARSLWEDGQYYTGYSKSVIGEAAEFESMLKG